MQMSVLSFPCTQYQNDILGFARDVLGFTLCFTLDELVRIRDEEEATHVPEDEQRPCLWPKQIEILLEVQDAVHDPKRKRVTVKSGHKISKSHTAAIIGHWFYSCFVDAKVVFSSTTFHQVQTILWDEFRKVRARSKITIPGDMHLMASSGFLSEDFRSARGFTAKEPEAVAGISGRNLIFIVDESSGVPDDIHEAIQGNTAGGACVIEFSNPTRSVGHFFETFHGKSDFYRQVSVSSAETPNAVTGRRLIPGLATREYVDEMEAEWGKDSPFYKIRILGEFVTLDDSKPFNLAVLAIAEEQWFDAPVEGRLHIGVDPAGPGSGGDETGFCVRRGKKVLEVYARSGLSEDAIKNEIAGLISKHKRERETQDDNKPVVAIDREGPIGYGVWSALKADNDSNNEPIKLLGVRASSKAIRRPDLYDLIRDELWGNLQQWFREGGTIPRDTKLEKELSVIEWTQNLKARLKATPKDDIRDLIKRSPDRADALALAVWEASSHHDEDRQQQAAPAPPPPKHPSSFDPYSGGIDPYGNL